MQTMKNKVGQNLAKNWLGKEPFKVGQKVDEVWTTLGQLLVKSWSAFKGRWVGQYLDKSWTDFSFKKVQQGYNHGTTFLRDKVCQGYANDMPEFRFNGLLQRYSNITPENGGGSLNKSGQNRYEIGTKMSRWFVGEMSVAGFGKVSVWFRYLQTLKVLQFLGKTSVDLRGFYLAIIQVIQPLSV